MQIGMVGVNHKLASVEVREKIARLCTKHFADKRILYPYFSYVLLSTCNRTEIYFHSLELAQTHVYLLSILRQGMDENFDQKVYSFFGSDCFFHLIRVTAGLDSAIVGETEIQGQVKNAYQQASHQRVLTKELHFLFQKALKLAKEIRHHSGQPKLPLLAKTIFEVATQKLGDLSNRKILLIGFSQINQTIAAWFEKKQVMQITYCNRSNEKLQALQLPFLLWNERHRWIEFDLIILGTKASGYLIEEVAQPLLDNKLLVDLSVPRNVAPELGLAPGISLFNIDQLCCLTENYTSKDEEEYVDIHQHILFSVKKQMSIFEFRELAKSKIYASI